MPLNVNVTAFARLLAGILTKWQETKASDKLLDPQDFYVRCFGSSEIKTK